MSLLSCWVKQLIFLFYVISSPFLQLRVHCAEALGTPIVGDYKYGWFVHNRWKQMPRFDIEPTTGKPYKLRRPEGLDVQKGSVLSKVPLLHLHCRELVLPNIAKFLHVFNKSSEELHPSLSAQPDVLRFVATMPSHMRISWNLMSSYLVWEECKMELVNSWVMSVEHKNGHLYRERHKTLASPTTTTCFAPLSLFKCPLLYSFSMFK